MTAQDLDTEELLRRACQGDSVAKSRLFNRHRARLKQMIHLRMDQRLAGRLDPSDVVQDALVEASQKLDTYNQQRPVPFYPWLRQIAWERLVELHRWHFRQKRNITREVSVEMQLSDESFCQLAGRLVSQGPSPSSAALQKEMASRVRQALDRQDAIDREILTLRHLEQLNTKDAAAVLGITVAAAKSRHLRAMQRLLRDLDPNQSEWNR